MKALMLIAAIAFAVPGATFAKHKYPYHHPGASSYCPPVYSRGSVLSFSFGSRPYIPAAPVYYAPTRTYTTTRYYTRSTSSIEASVQRALRNEGYYYGSIDGDIGPRSRAAIRDYQYENGLAVTGRIDSRLLRSLGI